MKKRKSGLALFLISGFIFSAAVSLSFAQDRSLEKQEQREAAIASALEALEPRETPKDIIEKLKERAFLKLKERRRQRLFKTRLSASVFYGYETNVNQDAETKGDFYAEEDFSFYWQPAFNEYFALDAGYWAIKQDYTELTDSSSLDNAFTCTLNVTPFEDGKIKFSPGLEYEWLWYPYAKESSYNNLKYFMKFKHYAGKNWNYGGGYEYSEKTYDEKKARDQQKRASPAIVREDTRQSVDVYLTRYLGKYTFKLKGKGYLNTSNDQYQEYYDYTSLKPSLVLSRAFLGGDKLYASLTSSYERKNYHDRLAVDSPRRDKVFTYKGSLDYSLGKNFTLNYSHTYKMVHSNYTEGRYKDITNVIGMTADF